MKLHIEQNQHKITHSFASLKNELDILRADNFDLEDKKISNESIQNVTVLAEEHSKRVRAIVKKIDVLIDLE
ncbi:UNVERIFIED_CONTAM: hypothetical protein O8I53_05265 [Campylobacter lari]